MDQALRKDCKPLREPRLNYLDLYETEMQVEYEKRWLDREIYRSQTHSRPLLTVALLGFVVAYGWSGFMEHISPINQVIAVLLVLVLLVSVFHLFAAINRDNRLGRKHERATRLYSWTRAALVGRSDQTPTRIEIIPPKNRKVSAFTEQIARLLESRHMLDAMQDRALPLFATLQELPPRGPRGPLVILTLWHESAHGLSLMLADRIYADDEATLPAHSADEEALAAQVEQLYAHWRTSV